MNEPVEVLSLPASEKGTYPIEDIQFLDTDDTVITPNADTVQWCLTDKDGNVQNDKIDQSLPSAASMIVLLEGDDLAISGQADGRIKRKGVDIDQYQRNVAVKGEVNSTLGNNLPVTKGFIFFIEKIVCI